MESIERLQHHTKTLNELHTIVKTMISLSAASVRQYKRATHSLTDYYRTVELGMHVVLKDMKDFHAPSLRRGEAQQIAAIIFGSDHGLCRRFNEDIAAYSLQRMNVPAISSQKHRLLAVGSRVASQLEQAGQVVEENFLLPGSATQIVTTVERILIKLDQWRNEDGIQCVYIFYNQLHDNGGYHPTGLELLPINLDHFQRLGKVSWPSRRLPTFTMEPRRLFASFLRQYFFVSIFRACAESQASEHASRLSAMQSAEKHLADRVEEMTTLFRRLRQEAITTELLDIMSGFEAVTAGDYK